MQSQAKPQPNPGRRVLVIDDDIDTAQTLFFLLLDMARKLRPEFVLLDIGLPDLEGSEVAAQLRRIPGCEQTLIIAITGLGNEHRPRMLKAGCDAFYVKPIEPKMLEDLLGRG